MTTKELTNEQKQQSLNMLGWFCAFAGVIGGILQAFFGQFAIFSEMIICFVQVRLQQEMPQKRVLLLGKLISGGIFRLSKNTT